VFKGFHLFRSLATDCKALRTLLLAFSPLLVSGLAKAADTTPPAITGFSFTPASVDVTASSQAVNVTLLASDDQSGVQFVTVTFTSPNVHQTQFAFLFLTAGTSTNGTFTGSATIPQFADNGTWHVTSIFIGDKAGNSINVPEATLISKSFPTTLPVTSNPDIQAPVVIGLPTFSPSTINVSTSDQTLTMTFSITDDVSGVSFDHINGFAMTLQSPSGLQHQYVSHGDFSLTSGTSKSGTWTLTHTMPRYSEAGNWSIQSLVVMDSAGNQSNVNSFGASNVPAQFAVISSPDDVTPPLITGFDFSPKFIDTSAGVQQVTVTISATDDLSGLDFSPDNPQISTFHGFQFTSPLHGQSVFCCAFSPTFTPLNGTTPLNGSWQAVVDVPQFSEEGTWHASILQVKDRVQNNKSLSTAQLTATSLPTDLIIIKPSLTSDGTIGTAGGTVADTVFGTRAQLTLPPGAVTANTTVAIDVLTSPLDIPLPTGFSGVGTYFVNITLTPVPSFPLAAPGATLILPLPTAGTPGHHLLLHSVDPTTGKLVPVASVSGGVVIGIINADGLSATFTGVSHASTLVGLIESTGTDTTSPVITPHISGTLGSNGWYVSSVAVSWTVTDPESGIASSTGCSNVTLSADTTGTVVACSATNGAGLTNSNSASIKIDQTLPSITYTGNAGTYTVDKTVNITCNASDATSGIASNTCKNISGPAYTFKLGNNTFNATATDKAGNQGSGSASFTVQVTFNSLISLVNLFETKSGVAANMVQALQGAASASAAGNIPSMDGQLTAFVNQVIAQSGKSLTASQANLLISLAQTMEK
jgi:hypothetical protein